MAFLDKVMFWKKEDPLASFEKNPLPPLGGGEAPGLGNAPMQSPGFPAMPGNDQFQQPPAFGALNEPKSEGGYPGSDRGGVDHDLRMEAPAFSINPQNNQTSAYALPQSNPQYPEVRRYPQMSQPPQQQAQYPPQNDNMLAKEMEIISTKLDYLRASLEGINQRLAHLERLAQTEEEQHHW